MAGEKAGPAPHVTKSRGASDLKSLADYDFHLVSSHHFPFNNYSNAWIICLF